MACYGICGAYDRRPKFCQDYPQVHDFVPPGCTFHFIGSERRGECQPKVCGQNNCCAYPREGGEPEARSLDAMAGGLPCKHLVWVEEPLQKVASEGDVPCANLRLSNLVNDLLEDI